MAPRNNHAPTSSVRLLEELPGIDDVVWATITRFAHARITTSLLFTAAEKHAGTSVLACATAIGLARHQRVPVCLLETNIRRPSVARYLDLESPGLSDVLDGRAELEDCLQEPRRCPGLLVLSAGSARAPVSGEFTTDRMMSVLVRLQQRCQYLVMDAAPVLDHLESRLLLRHVDAVLLVLRARATRRSDAERTHDILVESGTPVLGSIFNAFKADGDLGRGGRAHRSFPSAARTERPRASVGIEALPAQRENFVIATNGHSGEPVVDVTAAVERKSDEAHQREISILERRIVKLTLLLEQTEAEVRRISALSEVDHGIASIDPGTRGTSLQEGAQAFRMSLMQEIFQANLDLKVAMAQHA